MPKKLRALLIAVSLLVVLSLVGIGYSVNWTGFSGNRQTTISTITTNSTGTITTRSEEDQFAKTLWDWMQLLIVPLALALGAFYLNKAETLRSEKTTEKREQLERAAAQQVAYDKILETYLDRMSELLLTQQLSTAQADSPVISVARSRTLTTLQRIGLDGERKGVILSFLYELGLIEQKHLMLSLANAHLAGIIFKNANLSGADLSGANLAGADLTNTDLSHTRLIRADLSNAILARAKLVGVDLTEANLQGAILEEADLSHAQLHKANLVKASLAGADLTEANLTKANLSSTRLRGALLDRTNLYEAIVSEVEMRKAKPPLQGTIMPSGSHIV